MLPIPQFHHSFDCLKTVECWDDLGSTYTCIYLHNPSYIPFWDRTPPIIRASHVTTDEDRRSVSFADRRPPLSARLPVSAEKRRKRRGVRVAAARNFKNPDLDYIYIYMCAYIYIYI